MTHEEAVGHVADIAPKSVSPDLKVNFCTLWPEAKKGLQVLASIVPKLAPVINVIIAGGDALASSICR